MRRFATLLRCADAFNACHLAPQRHGLPLPDSGRVFPDTAGEESKTCIDVCAEFAGQQDRQTRCVRRELSLQPRRSQSWSAHVTFAGKRRTGSSPAEKRARWHSALHVTGCALVVAEVRNAR